MRRQSIPALPDAVTLLNLLLGFTSIISTLSGRMHLASTLILLAAVADGFDGYIARRKGQTSEFGKELDSLADLVSFGVAPAIILYTMFSSSQLAFFSALIPLCGALRLARYNIEKKHEGFTGLPIPAVGGFIAALTFTQTHLTDLLLIVTAVFLSSLMVSEVKYFKYKPKEGKKPILVYLLAASAIPPLLDLRLLFTPFLVYVLSGFLRD